MKRVAAAATLLLLALAGGGGAAWYFLHPSRSGLLLRQDPQFQVLKGRLQSLSDSLQSLDLRIRTTSGSDLDTLKTGQADLWSRYRQTRAELVSYHEKASRSPGPLLTDWVQRPLPGPLPMPVWTVLLGLVAVSAAAGTALALRGRRSPLPTPLRKARPARESAQVSFERTLRQLAAIAEKSAEAQPAPPAARAAKSQRATVEVLDEETRPVEQLLDEPVQPQPEEESVEEQNIEPAPARRTAPVRSSRAEQRFPTETLRMLDAEDEPESPKAETRAAAAAAAPADDIEKQRQDILKLARRGFTPAEISRRLRLSQDQVELVVKLGRDLPS